MGHLRSTILGDSLCRALEWCGADVLRLNHIGDWGTQFGMLIEYMAEQRPGGLAEARDEDVSDLQVLYRASKARFDEDEEFKKRARDAVTRLQGGDELSVAAWRRICEASRREFQAIYDRLGVVLEGEGEGGWLLLCMGVWRGPPAEDRDAERRTPRPPRPVWRGWRMIWVGMQG